MSSLAVLGGRLVGYGGEPRSLLIEEGRITGVGGEDQRFDESLDATGLLVVPGFIDLQCNGCGGIDLASEPERIWDLARLLPRFGVTSFLPTIISSPPSTPAAALEALARRPAGFEGAEPIGLHLEGPLLSHEKRGVHAAAYLRTPSEVPLARWRRQTGVAMVTLAPELAGSIDAIETLVRQGVVVSLGHSVATSSETIEAVEAGATVVTHLFNAMRPFDHHEPGLSVVALGDSRLAATLIADGSHVHPAALAAAWRALGPDRFAVVTDAVSALASPDSENWLGDLQVTATDGAARTEEGRLAGSTVPLNAALWNLRLFTGCSVEEAVATATATPARIVRAGERGFLAAGMRGDLAVVTPDFEVRATVVGGAVTYTA